MNNKTQSEVTNESFHSYHQRNCKICRHPDRAAIEHDFLHWRSPIDIGNEYDFSCRAIYRHAHAVGLIAQRKLNLRSSLELMIEDAGRVPSSADGVLRAIQLYARMNESGELLEVPKTQVIVISRDGSPVTLPPAVQLALTQPPPSDHNIRSEGPILERQPVTPCQTEIDLSH